MHCIHSLEFSIVVHKLDSWTEESNQYNATRIKGLHTSPPQLLSGADVLSILRNDAKVSWSTSNNMLKFTFPKLRWDMWWTELSRESLRWELLSKSQSIIQLINGSSTAIWENCHVQDEKPHQNVVSFHVGTEIGTRNGECHSIFLIYHFDLLCSIIGVLAEYKST